MTLSDFRKWLCTLSEAHALVPAAEVLERLPTGLTGDDVDDLAALDVDAAGELLGRSASTVRDYCRAGRLPGAFRQRGREWRIPADSIRAFQANESKAPNGVKPSGTVDLGSWREERGERGRP